MAMICWGCALGFFVGILVGFWAGCVGSKIAIKRATPYEMWKLRPDLTIIDRDGLPVQQQKPMRPFKMEL